MWDVTKATTADITRPLRVATWIVLVALFVRFSIWFLGEELVIETVVKFIVGLIGGRS